MDTLRPIGREMNNLELNIKISCHRGYDMAFNERIIKSLIAQYPQLNVIEYELHPANMAVKIEYAFGNWSIITY